MAGKGYEEGSVTQDYRAVDVAIIGAGPAGLTAAYLLTKAGYSVTVIEKDPDSSIPDRVAMLPKCLFDRHYVTENLHHDSFVIYF